MDFGDIHEEQLHSQKGSEVLISFLNGVTGILNNTWLLRILVDTPLPLPHGVGECTPRHLLENDDLFITCSICRQGGWVHSSESSLCSMPDTELQETCKAHKFFTFSTPHSLSAHAVNCAI